MRGVGTIVNVATVLVGTHEAQLEEVLAVIRESCRARMQYINPLPPIIEPGELHIPRPVEIQVGGATVFVLGVEKFERF